MSKNDRKKFWKSYHCRWSVENIFSIPIFFLSLFPFACWELVTYEVIVILNNWLFSSYSLPRLRSTIIRNSLCITLISDSPSTMNVTTIELCDQYLSYILNNMFFNVFFAFGCLLLFYYHSSSCLDFLSPSFLFSL